MKMMKRSILGVVTAVILISSWWFWRQITAQTLDKFVYLPQVARTETPMVELRGLWVTRFDWTAWNGASPARIDKIVQDAAAAGFNVLFFQVRGTADAYYDSTLEPWAKRASGVYGQPPNPYWDPLTYMIDKAHAAGLQVHAYLNIYPVAVCSDIPDAAVVPTPLYHQLIAAHGATLDDDGVTEKPNGLQWLQNNSVYCSGDAYLWGTPASIFQDDHVISVALDIANRYAIDGLHLDRIRYASSAASCDPVSAEQSGVPCFTDAPAGYASYAAWQRAQVDGTVRRFYNEVIAAHPDLWLSAAVWPVHTIKPEWGWTEYYQQGYATYYQDSKGWLAEGIIDSISPMIYPSAVNCPDDNIYWTQARWQTLVADYQLESHGRYIIPGIGTQYCDFSEIEARITMARAIGTAGHALFSYSALESSGFFDDLAAGPYAQTAVIPPIPWRATAGSE